MEQDHPCAGPEVDCQEHISLWQAVPRLFYLFFYPVMDRPFIHSVSLPSTRDMGSAPAARKPTSSVENESIL